MESFVIKFYNCVLLLYSLSYIRFTTYASNVIVIHPGPELSFGPPIIGN